MTGPVGFPGTELNQNIDYNKGWNLVFSLCAIYNITAISPVVYVAVYCITFTLVS